MCFPLSTVVCSVRCCGAISGPKSRRTLWNGKYVCSFTKFQSFSLGYRIKHAARYDIAITKPFFHYIVIGQSCCNVLEDTCSRRTVVGDNSNGSA